MGLIIGLSWWPDILFGGYMCVLVGRRKVDVERATLVPSGDANKVRASAMNE